MVGVKNDKTENSVEKLDTYIYFLLTRFRQGNHLKLKRSERRRGEEKDEENEEENKLDRRQELRTT